MKRLILMISMLALVASFLGCSGNAAGGDHPATTPNVNRDQAIAFAREAVRTAAEIYLQSQYKIPVTLTDAGFSVLDQSIIDPALKGGTFKLVVDPAAWAPARQKLISDGATKLAGVKNKDGSPTFDADTSTWLVTKAVDAVANVEKSYAAN